MEVSIWCSAVKTNMSVNVVGVFLIVFVITATGIFIDTKRIKRILILHIYLGGLLLCRVHSHFHFHGWYIFYSRNHHFCRI